MAGSASGGQVLRCVMKCFVPSKLFSLGSLIDRKKAEARGGTRRGIIRHREDDEHASLFMCLKGKGLPV